MRDPFDYPDHCTEDRIDDIVADILTLEEVCDLPDLERPISDPIPWNPTPPDPDPIVCACFPDIKFDPKIKYTEGLEKPKLKIKNINKEDCCSPKIDTDSEFPIPCLPENIDVDFDVVEHSKDAYFKVQKKMDSQNCEYIFDLKVPKGDPAVNYEFEVDIDGETKEEAGCGEPQFDLDGEFDTEEFEENGKKKVRVTLKLNYNLILPMYSKL